MPCTRRCVAASSGQVERLLQAVEYQVRPHTDMQLPERWLDLDPSMVSRPHCVWVTLWLCLTGCIHVSTCVCVFTGCVCVPRCLCLTCWVRISACYSARCVSLVVCLTVLTHRFTWYDSNARNGHIMQHRQHCLGGTLKVLPLRLWHRHLCIDPL